MVDSTRAFDQSTSEFEVAGDELPLLASWALTCETKAICTRRIPASKKNNLGDLCRDVSYKGPLRFRKIQIVLSALDWLRVAMKKQAADSARKEAWHSHRLS